MLPTFWRHTNKNTYTDAYTLAGNGVCRCCADAAIYMLKTI